MFVLAPDGDFYFLEVNTRIQVEHPVTEMITGIDIVKQQLAIAAGEKFSLKQSDIKIKGHAIECRINAEDPSKNFQPCPGTIKLYYAPGGYGVRIDSHAYAGYPVPQHYDSMIAKLIVAASSRKSAICRMSRALSEYLITGVHTNIPFQQAIFRNEDFCQGKYNTNLVERMIQEMPCP